MDKIKPTLSIQMNFGFFWAKVFIEKKGSRYRVSINSTDHKSCWRDLVVDASGKEFICVQGLYQDITQAEVIDIGFNSPEG